MRVLIVDDIGFVRSLIRDILVGAGHIVAAEARDGEEGLAMYRETRPDAVLLDIAMPRKDGLTALKELKVLDPDCRVVMCSSLSDEDNIVRALQLGATDFVVKPFRRQRLLSALEMAVRAGL